MSDMELTERVAGETADSADELTLELKALGITLGACDVAANVPSEDETNPFADNPLPIFLSHTASAV